MIKRKLRGGMVGGGVGAFIGPVHRMAATLDGQAEFVAGAFSSDPAKSKKSGDALFLDPARVYGNYREMARAEAALPTDKRIDFVSIVTPNNTHYHIAKTFLEAGFNVICDKPMTLDSKQARELKSAVERSGKIFALTHNYTGYPMVKQARYLLQKKELGAINKVVVEYPQGWLSGYLEKGAGSSNSWRMDPKKSGAACAMGDIGTHAENLCRYITGLHIDSVCADLTGFIPGNKLDDDGSVLLRFKGGARGVLMVSQICAGEENGLRIRVYGTKGGLEWAQEDPNYLIVKEPTGVKKIYSKGNPGLAKVVLNAGRLPPGHPDGFIEAFANIYIEVYRGIRAQLEGRKIPVCDYPTVEDGVVGMTFIDAVVASSRSKTKWTKMAR